MMMKKNDTSGGGISYHYISLLATLHQMSV